MQKLSISIFLFFLMTFSSTFAQKFEVTPYVGYQFAGVLNTIDGKLGMKDGMNYGLIFDVTVEKDMQAEFWYSRLETELSYKPEGCWSVVCSGVG